ncbi:MAG: hypothetical protein QW225_02615 [Candidatus Jordarchaeales archaeon]
MTQREERKVLGKDKNGEGGYLEALEKIRRNGSISGRELEELAGKLGERFWKALRTVTERRVKKYVFTPSKRVLWVVIGKRRDYLVISNFYCSCDDFYLNVVVRRNAFMCYHLLAKQLAEALATYDTYVVSDEEYEPLIREWKEIERERQSEVLEFDS